jgi:hypothetical protein
MGRRLAQLVVIGAAIGSLAGGASASVQTGPVTVAAPDSISVDPSSAQTTTLTLSSSSATVRTVRFAVLLDKGAVNVRPGHTSIGPYATRRVRLTLIAADKSLSTQGDLVITPVAARNGKGAAIAPSTSVPVVVKPATDDSHAEWILLGLSFLVAAWIVFVHCWFRMPHRFKIFGRTMGSVGWDFSKSWASNLTAVGAVVAAVLSASILPENTRYISSDGYTILSLEFGIMVVVAPFVYSATQLAKVQKGKEPAYKGHVWAFLIACVVTLWGVIGELGTSGLIFVEIEKAGSLPSHVAILGVTLIAVTFFLIWRYSSTTIGAIVESQGYLKQRRRAARIRAEHANPANTLAAAAVVPGPGPPSQELEQPRWPVL